MKPKIIVYVGLAILMLIVSFRSCEKIKIMHKRKPEGVLHSI